MKIRLSRRGFVKGAGVVAASVALGFGAREALQGYLPGPSDEDTSANGKPGAATSSHPITATPILMLGDSMAFYCNWPGVTIFGMPTKTLKEIEAGFQTAFQAGDYAPRYENVYVFAGTADACFPPGENLQSTEELKKSLSQAEILARINSEEKQGQLVNDFDDLIRFLKSRIVIQRLVIIGPFPHTEVQNYALIAKVNKHFASEYGPEFYDVADSFYSFSAPEGMREKSLFRDNIHLSDHGYDVLHTRLRALAKERGLATSI